MPSQTQPSPAHGPQARLPLAAAALEAGPPPTFDPDRRPPTADRGKFRGRH